MIYGHPAPCLVTLIDGGPTVMVEPLRFIPVSELPSPSGRALGTAGEVAPFSAPPATQNTGPRCSLTADTVRGCEGGAASVQKASGTTGYIGSSESIASTFFRSVHIGLNNPE